jgi:hypothetical protein
MRTFAEVGSLRIRRSKDSFKIEFEIGHDIASEITIATLREALESHCNMGEGTDEEIIALADAYRLVLNEFLPTRRGRS